jgi:hypothetical protein
MVAISGTLSEWMWNNKCYSIEGSLPFELGKSYKRRDGKLVTIIEVINTRGYETVRGDDAESPHLGCRYNRDSDRGRCTGTAGDFSDPHNLLPEFPEGHPNAAGEGFLVPLSMLGMNKSDDERAKFRELLILNDRCTEARYAALETQDWKAAHDQIFAKDIIEKVPALTSALGFTLEVVRPKGRDYRRAVYDFTHVFDVLIEDKRPFYAV